MLGSSNVASLSVQLTAWTSAIAARIWASVAGQKRCFTGPFVSALSARILKIAVPPFRQNFSKYSSCALEIGTSWPVPQPTSRTENGRALRARLQNGDHRRQDARRTLRVRHGGGSPPHARDRK